MNVQEVLADLVAEQEGLDIATADLSDEQWFTQTSSARWSAIDQIAHLAFFDDTAALAISDGERFGADAKELLSQFTSELAVDDATLGDYRRIGPVGTLERWRENRSRLATAAATLSDDDRVAWYGPSMGSKSFLTARLMETWAHGQDVLDAVGRTVAPTDRLSHIARLGFITRGWSYSNRGLEQPSADVRVSLQAPSGATWAFGDASVSESVSGPALDFCQVVAQRRHVDATSLVVEGEAARDWMLKAQIFAGPATDGPAAS